jgi:hypothetical protein
MVQEPGRQTSEAFFAKHMLSISERTDRCETMDCVPLCSWRNRFGSGLPLRPKVSQWSPSQTLLLLTWRQILNHRKAYEDVMNSELERLSDGLKRTTQPLSPDNWPPRRLLHIVRDNSVTHYGEMHLELTLLLLTVSLPTSQPFSHLRLLHFVKWLEAATGMHFRPVHYSSVTKLRASRSQQNRTTLQHEQRSPSEWRQLRTRSVAEMYWWLRAAR